MQQSVVQACCSKRVSVKKKLSYLRRCPRSERSSWVRNIILKSSILRCVYMLINRVQTVEFLRTTNVWISLYDYNLNRVKTRWHNKFYQYTWRRICIHRGRPSGPGSIVKCQTLSYNYIFLLKHFYPFPLL